MVCHSKTIASEEKIIGNKLLDLLIMTSLAFGVASIFYSDSIIIFHLCMGKEERFHLDILGQIPPSGILIRLNLCWTFLY